MNTHGLQGLPAPELRVPEWLENTDADLRLSDIDAPLIYLYNFQSWCPGCHSHGFPALKTVKDGLAERDLSDGMQFIAVQTVFEGHDENTADAARESLARHGLTDIPLGHDSGHPPTIMEDYRTGGTPWTVIIGPERTVLADGFQIDPQQVLSIFVPMLSEFWSPNAGEADG